MKTRKIPLRTCIGCKEVKPKREMIRIVRTPEGEIEVDRRGKKSGRGTYICPSKACLEEALKGKRLEHALDTSIPDEVLRRIRDEIEVTDAN